jgi:hypothetical protein
MHRIKELNPLPLVPVVFLRITIATDVVIVVSRLPLPIILDCKMLVKQLKFAFVYHERRSLNFEAHNLVGLCWSIGSKTWMGSIPTSAAS